MTNPIRKALRRTVYRRGKIVHVEPSKRLVRLAELCVSVVISLCFIEALSILVLRSFNWEVFSVITGLVGAVTGILVSQRA